MFCADSQTAGGDWSRNGLFLGGYLALYSNATSSSYRFVTGFTPCSAGGISTSFAVPQSSHAKLHWCLIAGALRSASGCESRRCGDSTLYSIKLLSSKRLCRASFVDTVCLLQHLLTAGQRRGAGALNQSCVSTLCSGGNLRRWPPVKGGCGAGRHRGAVWCAGRSVRGWRSLREARLPGLGREALPRRFWASLLVRLARRDRGGRTIGTGCGLDRGSQLARCNGQLTLMMDGEARTVWLHSEALTPRGCMAARGSTGRARHAGETAPRCLCATQGRRVAGPEGCSGRVRGRDGAEGIDWLGYSWRNRPSLIVERWLSKSADIVRWQSDGWIQLVNVASNIWCA